MQTIFRFHHKCGAHCAHPNQTAEVPSYVVSMTMFSQTSTLAGREYILLWLKLTPVATLCKTSALTACKTAVQSFTCAWCKVINERFVASYNAPGPQCPSQDGDPSSRGLTNDVYRIFNVLGSQS